MELLHVRIELFAENHIKKPTYCEVMPAKSKLAHFSDLKKNFVAVTETEIQPTMLYLHPTNWPQMQYFM